MPNQYSTDDYLAALEADRNNEGEPSSVTSCIRRALFQGESLTSMDAVARFGCSNGLLAIVVREMRVLGFQFVDEEEPGAKGGFTRTVYRLRNPRHRVSEQDVLSARAARPKRTTTKPSADVSVERVPAPHGNGAEMMPRRGRRPHKPPLPVLPEMGSTLSVTMLSIDPDTGLARMGLRNGAHHYEVTVDSQR